MIMRQDTSRGAALLISTTLLLLLSAGPRGVQCVSVREGGGSDWEAVELTSQVTHVNPFKGLGTPAYSKF